MTITQSHDFAQYLAQKQQLDGLIARQLNVLAQLNMSAWQRDVSKLRVRLQSDNFKVFVMGEFKRGKSTFINALLGQKVLPAYAIPCTAIINEVKWGEQPRAVLHWLASGDGKSKAPQEVPVDKIDQYVVIKESKSGHFGGQQVIYANPYERVELFWPLEICQDGVEIIDSPGLNEDVQRQEITLEYLKTVDIVLFTIACDFPVSSSEMQVLETIKDAGHEYIFFVCNRINMITTDERQMVMDRCMSMLSPYTKEGDKCVFFINAKGALDGRLSDDSYQIEDSHITLLEEKLKTFLATERGRVKLLRPAIELRSSLREALRTLPEREQLLHTDLAKIQERYTVVEAELRRLEEIRHQIYLRLSNARNAIKKIAFDLASEFYGQTANMVPNWIAAYELQEKMKVYEIFGQQARERVCTEVTTFLTNQVKQEQTQWQKNTFEPRIANELQLLARELDASTKQFVDDLEQARFDLVAGDQAIIVSGEEAGNVEKVTVMSRILGVAGGFLIGDISSMALGAAFGFNEMLKSLLPQLAIMFGVVALVGWNPIILIPSLLLGGGVQAFLKNNSINKKIKDAIGKEYALKLKENRPDLANKIANVVDNKLEEIQSALGRGLGLEIQNVRDQVDSVVALKQQEQSNIDQVMHSLQTTREELHAINVELDDYIKQLALSTSHF